MTYNISGIRIEVSFQVRPTRKPQGQNATEFGGESEQLSVPGVCRLPGGLSAARGRRAQGRYQSGRTHARAERRLRLVWLALAASVGRDLDSPRRFCVVFPQWDH